MANLMTFFIGIIGVITGQAAIQVFAQLGADLTKEHFLNRWLDSRVNREVQRALRIAFCESIRQIFQLYEQGGQLARRSSEEQTLLRERVRWLQEEETIEKMLPKIEEPGEQLTMDDITALFQAYQEDPAQVNCPRISAAWWKSGSCKGWSDISSRKGSSATSM